MPACVRARASVWAFERERIRERSERKEVTGRKGGRLREGEGETEEPWKPGRAGAGSEVVPPDLVGKGMKVFISLLCNPKWQLYSPIPACAFIF